MLNLCRFETRENLSDENISKKQFFISNVFKNLIKNDVGKKNTELQVRNKTKKKLISLLIRKIN